MGQPQIIDQSVLASDGIGSLLAYMVAALAGYAAVLLVQRGEQHRPWLWRSLAALSLGAGIADLHVIGLADLPATAGDALGIADLLISLGACLALGVITIHFASRKQIGGGASVLHCVIVGLGLCLLADHSLEVVSGGIVYSPARIMPILAIALAGSAISLAILRGLRTMPERSILPPRPMAGLFIGGVLSLTQSGVFHAALLPKVSEPVSLLPLWLPLAMSALVLTALALLIQAARDGLVVAVEDSSAQPSLIERSQLDESTRLPQRAAFMRQAPARIARAADLGLKMELIRCVVHGQGVLDAQIVERVARTLAQRLGTLQRSADLLARHDHFEFVLLRLRESGEARSSVAELLPALCAPMTDVANGARLPMTVQAGIAEFPRDGADIRNLLLVAAQHSQSAAIAEAVTAAEQQPELAGSTPRHAAA
ncbi:diguanylate cyclase domain-containing protein [Hydrocarboniphaga sp.]|uniref:diguanylate cyclase domain-containing protein n=1 Tax=Hydrocarboniphaga sp. TaxID=2033016 RepID=UPI003D142A5E